MKTRTAADDAMLQDTLVRMVVPMRREFAAALDVPRMKRDEAYARAIVTQASQSSEARLREYAKLVEPLLLRAPTVRAPTSSDEDGGGATGRTSLQGRSRVAANLLLAAVGPLGEALAIRLERAGDAPALAASLRAAHDCIAAVRGSAAAREFLRNFETEAPKRDRMRADREVRERSQLASRQLLESIGPMGEPLALEIERAIDSKVLADLVQQAQALVADMCGAAAADAYGKRLGLRETAALSA